MTATHHRAEAIQRGARMLRTALGPAIARFLEDPAVVEVMLNPDGRIWIDRLSEGLADTGETMSPADGERIVFFEDQGDKPGVQPGQRQLRSYSFAVGVISRDGLQPRQQAHQDYRTAKRTLRLEGMRAVTAAGVEVAGSGLVEGEVRFRLENIDVGGGLVLGLFTLDYRDPN